MLTLYSGGQAYPLKVDDYYIRQLASGRDELIFNISIWDELFPEIVEEASITDRDQMAYLVKAIDQGPQDAKIRCELDLDDWRATLNPQYTNGSATVYTTVSGVAPAGWTVQDTSNITIQRTITGAYTPLEVVEACRDVYGVTFRWDNKAKTITIINMANFQPLGAFITRDLNLRELNYKGSSSDFITRLYAYGADGLTFSDINNGLPYVDDNTYSSRVICGYWSDDRYTNAENLLADAKTKLAALAVPTRSYTCSVYDLAKTNPEMYGFENFSLFQVVTLIDQSRNTQINHQVVEYWDYPYYPVKNQVTLSNSPIKIQSQITQISQEIQNPNSTYNQKQAAAISNATNWITGTNGGYVVFQRNAEGQPYEILIMDQPTIETATKVWRWNNGGLGYSSNGYNGPYTTAITQDGAIVADFITTGTLNCQLLDVINLVAQGVELTGQFTAINGDFIAKFWAAAFDILDGTNKRVSIYASPSPGNQGVLQIFGGNWPESETPDSTGRVTTIGAFGMTVGADQDGTPTGSVSADTMSAVNGFYLGAPGSSDYFRPFYPTNGQLGIGNLAQIYINGIGGNVGWKTVQTPSGQATALCLT